MNGQQRKQSASRNAGIAALKAKQRLASKGKEVFLEIFRYELSGFYWFWRNGTNNKLEALGALHEFDMTTVPSRYKSGQPLNSYAIYL